MVQYERLKIISDMLSTHGKVETNDLAEKFNVSRVTIRKDLDVLQEQGGIKRYYGGATSIDHLPPVIKERNSSEIPSYSDKIKENIAKYALNHISPGDTIFIGSGVTCTVLADLITKDLNLTVITNNISALPSLSLSAKKVIVIGGEIITIDSLNYFSWTDRPSQYLDNIFVNKVFTSCTGLDLKAGITVNAVVSTYIFKCLPSIKREWIMLAESSKFDKTGIYQVNTLDGIDVIISDDMPKEYFDYFHSAGIKTEVC